MMYNNKGETNKRIGARKKQQRETNGEPKRNRRKTKGETQVDFIYKLY